MIELKCPYCHNENTNRIPTEIVNSKISEIWWFLLICSLLGAAIQPIVLTYVFVFMVCDIIKNVISGMSSRKYWFMQCPRCGHQYKILNPYRAEKINSDKQREMEQRREKYAKLNQDTEMNGKLLEDEQLITEINSIGYHKNVFSTTNYRVKITDKCKLIYNSKGSFRIYNDDIISIKKKNYFFVIPTGICISTRILNKKKKLLFVVAPSDREKIIEQLA